MEGRAIKRVFMTCVFLQQCCLLPIVGEMKSVALSYEIGLHQNTVKEIELKGATPFSDVVDNIGQLTWSIDIYTNSSKVDTSITERLADLVVETVSVEVRGLYHPQASDLVISLAHEDQVLFLSKQRGKEGVRFGFDENHGYDYVFADIEGDNLAFGKPGKQSTTLDGDNTAAYRATDGETRYSGVATKTALYPWYEVDLGATHLISTIVIYTPDPDNKVNEIQTVTTVGLVTLAGFFRLRVQTAAGSFVTVTESIHFNAVPSVLEENPFSSDFGIGKGESMQSKLEGLENIGLVEVSRNDADRTGGHTWVITFLTERENMAEIEVFENNLTAGRLRLPSDQVAEILVSTKQNGTSNSFYNAQMRFGSVLVSSEPFPEDFFYEQTFPTHSDDITNVTRGFIDALYEERFVFSFEQKTTYIQLKKTGIEGKYLRVLLREETYLSFSEILVFSKQFTSIQFYTGGSPIPGGIYPPETAFQDVFGGMKVSGTWQLSIRDMRSNSESDYRFHLLRDRKSLGVRRVSNSIKAKYGFINDWVLHIKPQGVSTDQEIIGYVSQYATVLTLPKYGKLFLSGSNGKT